jgi:formate hydrogenlyase transcriptional activator
MERTDFSAAPPLHQRSIQQREDIPALVAYFVRQYSERMSKQISQISRQAIDDLMSYAWPGNIRELRNLIERAVIVTPGDTLRVPAVPSCSGFRTEPVTLEEAERDHILQALEESKWVVGGKAGAAARLGVKQTTLLDKMRRRGLSRNMCQAQLAV